MLPFLSFDHIYVVDFEFISKPGERQQPVCVVSHELLTGETKRLWLAEVDPLTLDPPYSLGKNDLFIAYFSSAEWHCHLSLNWPMPTNVIDLYAEYKIQVNHSGIEKEKAGLLDACRRYGIKSIDSEEKENARNRILQGPPYSEEEKVYILKYCESDVLETAELFRRMISNPDFDLSTALFRGEYMKTIASMEYHGIPVDIDALNFMKLNWDRVKLKLIKDIDRDYNVFEGTKFKVSKFEAYVSQRGWAWPRTEKGNLKLDDDTFKEMVELHPELRPLKDLRYILGKLHLKDLPIGSDGRSRAMLSPFATKTGRNAPKGRFMFALAACMRSLIKPEPGKVLAYIDYSQQEFFIAAVLSDDQNMKTAYYSGDPYLAFAKQAGAAPPEATKASHKEVRSLFKTCVLGVQYGLGAESLALKINKSTPYARELLGHHKRVYKRYWSWADITWTRACLLKKIETCYGWRMAVKGSDRKEMLTVKNFPIQATGAEILRVACIRLIENNIKLIAPIHDAVMIECDEETAAEEILLAMKIMSDASEVVLGAGNRLRTEADIIRYPGRYIDEKGTETWDLITNILAEIKEEGLRGQTNLSNFCENKVNFAVQQN
ncbi:hypothetical protein DU38_05225 [Methanosarcina mazei]|uniref:DNA-directed DNA polymerase family A palm domain-containing protein n=1 Tax=Methanosarcina mazei TaxID=2209 RepID=A0A0F8EDN1_METMZ|nr:DNA polymerase [Methanosarcina mazei]KKG31043.1 hypothetical protein DU49_04255 [Methanosarcina mazei]KKG38797.1 hypothetical protein DU35_11420 [Methanosarcina mazei]KKG39390.1 hypothetical protein DU41_16160 [Methanosarcina mazei]KKG46989.1 hypothetical protein DU39_05080 [Methanosarcina mazei]KKG47795.1 hypothetical protein DU38_05225 [Methanosarcina mazei]